MKVEDGDGVLLFESKEWGGVKFYQQISPTIRANKVCAAVVLIKEVNDDNRRKNKRDDPSVQYNET